MNQPNLIIVGDQAYSPEEYAAYRRMRDKVNAKERARYATDPEYRARRLAEVTAWKRRNRVVYKLASLHDVGCTGPTYRTGCRCHKVVIHGRSA
jgi:hypothetical protein